MKMEASKLVTQTRRATHRHQRHQAHRQTRHRRQPHQQTTQHHRHQTHTPVVKTARQQVAAANTPNTTIITTAIKHRIIIKILNRI